MHFYTGDMFPAEYENAIFSAQHGSWNRTVPVGARVMVTKIAEDGTATTEPFAEGWLDEETGEYCGRPVDVAQLRDGSILVSDDLAGRALPHLVRGARRLMRAALVLGLGGLLLAGAVPAQDVEAGRKVAGMCRTCHGLDGLAVMPVAPSIGGEPAAYIAAQLEAFRSGARQHEMMSVVAAGLGDQQIADVAAWYAAQTATAVPPPGFDPAGAPEACVACHGADGIAVIDEAPNLAGENAIYIDTQLKAFRSGKRASEIMTPVAEGLDDAAIRAAADWYAAIGLEVAGPEPGACPRPWSSTSATSAARWSGRRACRTTSPISAAPCRPGLRRSQWANPFKIGTLDRAATILLYERELRTKLAASASPPPTSSPSAAGGWPAGAAPNPATATFS